MGYDGLSTTTFAGDQSYVSYETQGQGYQYVTDYAASGSYDPYGSYQSTGTYDTTAWTAQETYLSTVPSQSLPADGTGSWDSSAWNTQGTDFQPTSFGYESTGAEQTGHWTLPGYGQDTGTYDATAWNGGLTTDQPEQPEQLEQPDQAYAYEATTLVPVTVDEDGTEPAGDTFDDEFADGVHHMLTQTMPVTPADSGSEPRPEPRSARRAGGKNATAKNASAKNTAGSRRRSPAKRSALLTVAVPSVCVMGVAGVAAASVGGLTGAEKPADEPTTMAAADPASVKPVAANNKLDTQLAALSADAGDFADRASRTQERIDLRTRQEEEKKKRAEEAAAKEAARPKFAVPVAQRGLSASFGQGGGMWMSVHTGIDFPVSYGTPVMAATDGTVRTQWNSAYGNMAIVTSPEGTETWYCHLSSTKIRSGKVKAGEVIAYSGNSGNSTGPHLHFEVRPGSGSPIDPQAWLGSHGLDAS
ncbi:M23 family metallopeptidase [Streptomyces sp. NBC_00249]|uniref:M23 family metallopeptidase n=1 Tax=Streptomyces sp. NBC_00249 TaxID=2975690 RepID=UPI00225BD334|nr:M23 family metallopeptidase [Streptomyces sp. NBC_00249]MCX5194898.1 M23 family metallopeptidase [Streptomyces sp. NBC_00249]